LPPSTPERDISGHSKARMCGRSPGPLTPQAWTQKWGVGERKKRVKMRTFCFMKKKGGGPFS